MQLKMREAVDADVVVSARTTVGYTTPPDADDETLDDVWVMLQVTTKDAPGEDVHTFALSIAIAEAMLADLTDRVIAARRADEAQR